MQKIIYLVALLLLVVPSLAPGMEEVEVGVVVVSATKTVETIDKVPSSVTVITAEEIERKQATTVLEMLRDVPGLDVVQSGGPGKNSSVFIRGGNSGHTLVMIDGVQVNSPTLGSYNFADLTTDNIDRIEVVRGPQSTLYGSDAMAGVINIITKKGKGAMRTTVSTEAGSFSTYRGSASISGSGDKSTYSLSLSRVDTDGISAASEKNGNNEDDGYENSSLSARFGYKLNENIDLDVTSRYTDSENDLDAVGADDLNYTQESELLLASARVNHIIGDIWDHSLQISLTDENINYKDPDTSGNNSKINTKIETAGWQHNLSFFDETNMLTLGYEYEKQEGRNNSASIDHSVKNNAFYIQDQMSFDNDDFNVTVGIRNDDHSKFGDKTTYRLAASYLFSTFETRIKSNWGKGFKAPTLNDLFYQDSWGSRGNPNLKPEESKAFDIGVEQSLADTKVTLSATYFRTDYDNLIDWVEYAPWSYEPQNVKKSEVKGWEFGFKAKPAGKVYIQGAYTITKAEDKSTGRELARRPENKGSISVGWQPEKVNIDLTINYVGHRWSDPKNRKKLDSYTKADLAAACNITNIITLFGRVENLTDEEYEEVKGYGTAGRSYYAGLKATF